MFFFFKQKTAYEMRISDWSSDVCSSDLLPWTASPRNPNKLTSGYVTPGYQIETVPPCGEIYDPVGRWGDLAPRRLARHQVATARQKDSGIDDVVGQTDDPVTQTRRRSEEHTSELQSLMRISYAVFCLKKKKKNSMHTQTRQTYT